MDAWKNGYIDINIYNLFFNLNEPFEKIFNRVDHESVKEIYRLIRGKNISVDIFIRLID